jgi:hypothetical protein
MSILGAIKLAEKRHLDQVVLLIIRLLLDHMFFSCGAFIYRKCELTKDHSSTSRGDNVHEITKGGSSCDV